MFYELLNKAYTIHRTYHHNSTYFIEMVNSRVRTGVFTKRVSYYVLVFVIFKGCFQGLFIFY